MAVVEETGQTLQATVTSNKGRMTQEQLQKVGLGLRIQGLGSDDAGAAPEGELRVDGPGLGEWSK